MEPGLKDGVCPRCGSEHVVSDVQLLDRGDAHVSYDLAVRIERNPAALLFKQSTTYPIQPYICGDCGYLDLYVKDPDDLEAGIEERERNLGR